MVFKFQYYSVIPDLEPEQPTVRVERDSAKSGEDQLKRNPAKQPFRCPFHSFPKTLISFKPGVAHITCGCGTPGVLLLPTLI